VVVKKFGAKTDVCCSERSYQPFVSSEHVLVPWSFCAGLLCVVLFFWLFFVSSFFAI
jgi:hypothetical protein